MRKLNPITALYLKILENSGEPLASPSNLILAADTRTAALIAG